MSQNLYQKLLEYYSLQENDILFYKNQSLNTIKDFHAFKDVFKIVDYLKDAISKNRKILIYGDYDCDGITSVSIMYLTLKTNEYKPGYYIPNRDHDGYGITKENIDLFHSLNYEIIVLVDNGISLNENVEYINSLGMECIILDHHKIMNEIPKAKYIMHPDIDEYGPYNISAGEVSFFFSWAYLGHIDDYLLVLAMLSTIGDVMPIQSYNKVLVREGLKILNESKNYDFKVIKNLVGKELDSIESITEDEIARYVVPKINSICRVKNDNSRFNIVKYFIYGRCSVDYNLSRWIDAVNDQRKQLVEENQKQDFDNEKNIIFIENKSVEGISGLIASKFYNDYDKPTFVICKNASNPKLFKGSARSGPGYDVSKALDYCKEYLAAYGGHEGAGGFSVYEENVEALKEKLNDKNLFNEASKENKDSKFIDIDVEDLTLENYRIIREFAPFGETFKKPIFRIKDIPLSLCTKDKSGKHLFFRPNQHISIVYFNFDPKIETKQTFNILGNINIHVFRGVKSIQFNVNEVQY